MYTGGAADFPTARLPVSRTPAGVSHGKIPPLARYGAWQQMPRRVVIHEI